MLRSLSILTLISTLSINSAFAKEDQAADFQNFRPSPQGKTVGMGVGITVPSDKLDTFILRVRMSPTLTLEPMLNYSSMSSSDTQKIEDPTDATKTIDTTTTTDFSSMGGGLSMRYRVGKHGNTDLNAIAGVGYVQYSSESKIEGVEGKSTATGSSTVANIGLGMESFIAPKWSAGFDATTPIYAMSSGASDTAESSSTSMAFAPTFRLMLAHYF